MATITANGLYANRLSSAVVCCRPLSGIPTILRRRARGRCKPQGSFLFNPHRRQLAKLRTSHCQTPVSRDAVGLSLTQRQYKTQRQSLSDVYVSRSICRNASPSTQHYSLGMHPAT